MSWHVRCCRAAGEARRVKFLPQAGPKEKKGTSAMPGFSRVLVALAALLLPATVTAQPTTEVVPAQAPGWVFTPSVGFGGSWNNNLLLASEGDRPLSDFGTPIDSGLNLDFRGRRLNLSGSYTGSFVMYRTYDELNAADQRAHAYMDLRMSQGLKLFAKENFIRAPSTDVLNLAGVPFYRTGSQTNEAGGGVEAVVARHTTLVAGYVLRSVTFDQQAGQQLQDGYEHEWTVSLARQRSTRLTVGAQYDLRHEVLSHGTDQFNIQQGGATVEYTLTRSLDLSGLLGVAVLGAGLTHEGSVGPAVQARLLYRVRETRLSASYQRSFVPSFGFGGTFQNEALVGTAHVPIASSRVYVESNLSWFNNDSLVIGQPSLRSMWLSASGGYRVSRRMTVEGYANRSTQDAQRPGGNITGTVIGFRVVISKPMRIR